MVKKKRAEDDAIRTESRAPNVENRHSILTIKHTESGAWYVEDTLEIGDEGDGIRPRQI